MNKYTNGFRDMYMQFNLLKMRCLTDILKLANCFKSGISNSSWFMSFFNLEIPSVCDSKNKDSLRSRIRMGDESSGHAT
jgi:hypothetical protein